jgi:hypothetical protein
MFGRAKIWRLPLGPAAGVNVTVPFPPALVFSGR